MKTRTKLLALVLGTAIGVAACSSAGGDGETQATAPEAAPDTAPAAEVVEGDTPIAVGTTSLGDVLVDANGLTLYGFLDDADGISTCYDQCADAWPPVLGAPALANGLDAALFTTTPRDDGTEQITTGPWPLYTFAGDGAPGDVNGQASGDVWFAVAPDGSLIGAGLAEEPAAEAEGQDEAAAPEAEEAPADDIGDVLTDAEGYSLYAFTNDAAGVSNCNAPCSDTWPPVLLGESLGQEVGAARLSTVARQDGATQLAIDGRPVYRYAGDDAPGDVNGQGVGDVWFVFDVAGNPVLPSGTTVGSTDIGDVLIDPDGFTLYVFANDAPGVSNCTGDCAVTWPPVPAATPIDPSLDAASFGSILRDDASEQLTWKDQPLYRYAGDQFPGDANGVAAGNGNWNGVAIEGAAAPAQAPAEAPAEAPAPAENPAPTPSY